MAPTFRRATMSFKGPVEARKPLVILSVDAASAGADGKAAAYIARITLGTPQASALDMPQASAAAPETSPTPGGIEERMAARRAVQRDNN